MSTNDHATAAKFAGQPTDERIDMPAHRAPKFTEGGGSNGPVVGSIDLHNPVDTRAETVRLDKVHANFAARMRAYTDPDMDALSALQSADSSRLAPTVAALRDECNALNDQLANSAADCDGWRHACEVEGRTNARLTAEANALRDEGNRIRALCETLRRTHQATCADLSDSRAKVSRQAELIRRQAEALGDHQAYQDFRAKWEGVDMRGQGGHRLLGWPEWTAIAVTPLIVLAVVVLKLAGWL